MDKSFQEKLHLFAKYALKGDEEAMRFVINILLSLGLPQTNAVAYLFVYQSIMNTYIDLKEECRKCGGVCCRFGEPVELYNFDIEDLKALSIDLSRYIFKSGDRLYLPRPCSLQNGWACGVHSAKPYACLSYPFAVEDLQKEIISSHINSKPPKPFIPHFCIAGQKVWSIIESAIREHESIYGKEPTPYDLLEHVRRKIATNT